MQRYTVESDIGLMRCLGQTMKVCNAFAIIVTSDVGIGTATSP